MSDDNELSSNKRQGILIPNIQGARASVEGNVTLGDGSEEETTHVNVNSTNRVSETEVQSKTFAVITSSQVPSARRSRWMKTNANEGADQQRILNFKTPLEKEQEKIAAAAHKVVPASVKTHCRARSEQHTFGFGKKAVEQKIFKVARKRFYNGIGKVFVQKSEKDSKFEHKTLSSRQGIGLCQKQPEKYKRPFKNFSFIMNSTGTLSNNKFEEPIVKAANNKELAEDLYTENKEYQWGQASQIQKDRYTSLNIPPSQNRLMQSTFLSSCQSPKMTVASTFNNDLAKNRNTTADMLAVQTDESLQVTIPQIKFQIMAPGQNFAKKLRGPHVAQSTSYCPYSGGKVVSNILHSKYHDSSKFYDQLQTTSSPVSVKKFDKKEIANTIDSVQQLAREQDIRQSKSQQIERRKGTAISNHKPLGDVRMNIYSGAQIMNVDEGGGKGAQEIRSSLQKTEDESDGIPRIATVNNLKYASNQPSQTNTRLQKSQAQTKSYNLPQQSTPGFTSSANNVAAVNQQQLLQAYQSFQMPKTYIQPQNRGMVPIPQARRTQSMQFPPNQKSKPSFPEPTIQQPKYQYHPKENEFHENDIALSAGNVYNETNNPALAKFFNQVQGHISESYGNQLSMKDQKQKLFKMMKESKHNYIQTLLEGEQLGHCSGISKRMDPTLKYALNQKLQKEQQYKEERIESIKEVKKQQDQAKLEARRARVKEKLQELREKKLIGGSLPKGKSHVYDPEEVNGMRMCEQMRLKCEDRIEDKVLRSLTVKLKKSETHHVQHHTHQTTEESLSLHKNTKQHRNENNNILNQAHQAVSSGPVSPQDSDCTSSKSCEEEKFKLEAALIMTKNLQKGHQSIKKKQSYNNKKRIQYANELLHFLNIQDATATQLQQLYSKFQDIQSAQYKLRQYMSSSSFVKFKDIVGKTMQSNVEHQSHIFTQPHQLGLVENHNFRQFFVQLSEEKKSYKFCRLKRASLTEYLQERYTKDVGERIMMFLGNQFTSLYKISFEGFCQVIMELVNAGPEFHKRLLFASLSLHNQGRICEHDLFNMIENYKQRENFFFYKELISSDPVPRDYQDVVDFSDKIFFEAYCQDFKLLAQNLNFRRYLQGIEDSDCQAKFGDDVNPEHYDSVEDLEEQLANHIDYMIGLILKESGTFYQNEVLDIIINETSLQSIRIALYKLLINNRILHKKEAKTCQSPRDGQHEGCGQQKTVNLLKPNGPLAPCLGPGIVQRTGKKVTNCIYLTFEDMNKLLVFKPGFISTFIEDLVSHLTVGLISQQSVERYLGHLRHQPQIDGFSGFTNCENLQQFLVEKKLEQMRCPELTEHAIPLQTLRNQKTKDLQVDFDDQVHIITNPYEVQETRIDGQFGKQLVMKVLPVKSKTVNEPAAPDKIGLLSAKSKSTQDKTVSLRPKFLLIQNQEVQLLHDYRKDFGQELFFRLFRVFYKLCVIPEEAQNNPFAIYMDRLSTIRGFQEVFGIEQDEVAVRFHKIFMLSPEASDPRPMSYCDAQTKKLVSERQVAYEAGQDPRNPSEVKVLRFYAVMKDLLNIEDQIHAKLAFNFYDYDNNGNIGSVDILNFRRHFIFGATGDDYGDFERLLRIFEEDRIQKNIKNSLQFLLKGSDRKALFVKEKPQRKEYIKRDQNQTVTSQTHDTLSRSSQENESEAQAELDERTKILTDPWNRFLVELQLLRNHFVDEAIMNKNKLSSQDFLDFKQYEQRLLPIIELKYGIQTPSMVYFFKKILEYPFDFYTVKGIEGSLYHGFKKEGYTTYEVKLTQELVLMQQTLDQISFKEHCSNPMCFEKGFVLPLYQRPEEEHSEM